MSDTNTDKLMQRGYDAEDAGREVEYYWHDTYHVLRSIVIEGVEFENPGYDDEVDDQYWLEDSYRVAEMVWRQ